MSQVEQKLFRCEADDPNRCQGVGQGGQCPFKAEEGSKFCLRHGGNKAEGSRNKAIVRNYRLTEWRARVFEFADNDQIKSLREEIGILRMTLEAVLNACRSNTDLLIQSNRINMLTDKVERLVVSCHKLEERTGALLDKQAILSLADQLVTIIGECVPPDKLTSVAEKIITTIVKFNEPTTD